MLWITEIIKNFAISYGINRQNPKNQKHHRLVAMRLNRGPRHRGGRNRRKSRDKSNKMQRTKRPSSSVTDDDDGVCSKWPGFKDAKKNMELKAALLSWVLERDAGSTMDVMRVVAGKMKGG